MKNALNEFTQRYQQTWQTNFAHEPKSENLYGIDSPCIVHSDDEAVYWQAISIERDLSIVEEVINLTIHPSAHLFYGTQYAGDMEARFNDLRVSLIQPWSDDDFSRLEQNLIAHLTMQRKLKRRPTIFIGSIMDDDSHILSIDNQTGQVILEKLIENETEVLSLTLDDFLRALIPVAQ